MLVGVLVGAARVPHASTLPTASDYPCAYANTCLVCHRCLRLGVFLVTGALEGLKGYCIQDDPEREASELTRVHKLL